MKAVLSALSVGLALVVMSMSASAVPANRSRVTVTLYRCRCSSDWAAWPCCAATRSGFPVDNGSDNAYCLRNI